MRRANHKAAYCTSKVYICCHFQSFLVLLYLWLTGIKKLEMQAPGSDGRRNYETTGVFSPDGEYLPFVQPIVTEGRPEEWLNRVEEAMFAATKKHLFRVGC